MLSNIIIFNKILDGVNSIGWILMLFSLFIENDYQTGTFILGVALIIVANKMEVTPEDISLHGLTENPKKNSK
jgi:hypothetical protein